MKGNLPFLFNSRFLLLFIFLALVKLNSVAFETIVVPNKISTTEVVYTLTDDDVVIENGVIMTCSYDFSITDIVIPDTLDGQVVNGIARDVFASKGITSVDLSRCNSLTTIESYAFSNNVIVAVQFPVSLQAVGQYAFMQNGLTNLDFSICSELQVIDVSSFSQNNIETANFSGCTALQQIGDNAFFYNKLTVLDLSGCTALQEISAFAFKNNNLISVQLPVSLRKIGDEAFYLNQIESVNFSDIRVLELIGNRAFLNNNLISVDLSDHSALQSIGESAFEQNNIISISFSGCRSLQSLDGFGLNRITSINLSGLTALQSISNNAFVQNDIENIIFDDCTALQIIEDRAFRDNNLGLVDLSPCKSLKTIMYAVFENNQVGCGVILPTPDIPGYNFNNWKASDGNEYTGGATFYNLASTYWADLTEVFAVRFIISEGGNPISGAVVSFGGDETDTTDNSGIASFINISDGTYTYTVSADGYETVSSSITVSGVDVSEDVEMISTVDPNARILLAENSRFKIWGVAADAPAADTVLSVLTQSYDRVATALNTQLGVITVDIYPDLDTYHAAMGWTDASDWMVGSASGESNIRIVSPFNPGPVANFNGILEVAVHEMVHCFVRKISNYSVPIWINEGTATYYAYQGPPNSGTIQIYIDNLGHKPSFDELSSSFGDIGGYQFSYTIAEFIIEQLGGTAMLVEFLASNEDYSILGYDSKPEFQTAWHNYLDEHYFGIANTYSVTLTVTDGQNPIIGTEVIFSGYEDQPVYTDANGRVTKAGFSNTDQLDYWVFASGYNSFTGVLQINGADVEETVQLAQSSGITFTAEVINNCDCAASTSARVVIESGSGTSYFVVYKRLGNGLVTQIDTSETFTEEIIVTGLVFSDDPETDVYYEFFVIDNNGNSSEDVIVEDAGLASDIWQNGISTVYVEFAGGIAPYTIYKDDVAVESGAQAGQNYSFSVAPGEHIFRITDGCGCSVNKSIVIESSDQAYTLTCDDVTMENGVITACSYDFSKTDIIIPDTLCDQVVIGIGYRLFRFKGVITSVQFPEMLEFIEDEAFVGNQIANLDFSRCNNLHTIGNLAFLTNNLSNLDLPAGLTSLGGGAFNGNHIETLNGNAFDGFFYALNPDGAIDYTRLVSYAKLTTSVVIPSQVEILSSHALNSTGITSVNFSQCVGLKTIGYRAFFDNQIPSVDLSKCVNLERIENSGFLYAGLNSIDLSSCVHLNFIGSDAFTSNNFSAFILPTPLREGFQFINWTNGNNNEFAGGETVSDLNLAYTANFIEDASYLPLSFEVEVTDATCENSADGKLVITISGGLGGSYDSNGQTEDALYDENSYDVNVYYSNSDSVNIPSMSDSANVCNIDYGLQPGVYTVKVIDARGSFVSKVVMISSPVPLDFDLIKESDVTCAGSTDGSFSIIVSGGTFPYQYGYSEVAGEMPSEFVMEGTFAVPAGVYFGWVKDANGCVAGGDLNSQHRIVIDEPSPLVINSTVEVFCDEATLELYAMGGTAPYQYNISASNDGTIISNPDLNIWRVAVGAEYFIETTDAMGCIKVDTIYVEAKDPFTFTVEMVDVCYGAEYANAKVTVNDEGPGASFKVVFARFENGGQVKIDTSDFFNKELILSGLTFDNNEQKDVSYQFIVIDGNSCASESKTVVFEPVASPLAISTIELEQSEEKTNTEIWAEGGTSPYKMLLNGAIVSTNADKILFTLAAGTHVIEVVDAMNCSVYDTLVIEGAKTEDVEFVITDGFGLVSGAVVTLSEFGTITSNSEGRVIFNNIADGTYSYTVSAENYIVYTGSVTVSGSRVTEEVTLEEIVPETYSVEFIVTDGNNPISGAIVILGDSTSITNENGIAGFESVVDGTYDYSVSADRYENYTGSLTVAGNDITEEFTLQQVISETHFVKFVVTSEGNPVSGAVVTLDSSLLITTGSNGQAVFSNIPDGTYNYTVTADGYIEINDVVIVSGGNLVQSVYLSIESYVVKFVISDGTNPVPGALVELFGYAAAETNNSGIVTIEILANETELFYSVKADGYTASWDTITVTEGDVTEQVVLSAAHSVLFTVLNEASEPVAGAAVELEGYGTVISDNSGHCYFEGVADSELLNYKVSAIGFDIGSGTVSVNSEDVVKEILISESLSETYSVTFSVVDSTGPIPGAMVSISGYGTQETDNNGETHFYNVFADSSLVYSVSVDGYDLFIGYRQLADEDLSILVNMTPVRIERYSVSFVVNDGENPIEGALVSFGKYGSLTSDSSGKVTFENISPAEKMAYSVFANDFYLENGTVKVEGADAIFELALQSSVHEVKFNVLSNEKPIEGAYVLLGDYGTKVTDDRGTVTFENVYDEAQIEYCVYSAGSELKIGSVSVLNTDVEKTLNLIPVNKDALINTFEVTFTVVNRDIPIENATVFFGTYGFDNTDSAGKLSFKNVKPADKIAYCVKIDGYGLVLGETDIADADEDILIDINEVTYNAEFTVVENGQPIKGALVNLQKYGVLETNSEGIALFTGIKANSNLTYSVSADNCNLEYGSLLITDADVTETIRLSSESNMNVRFVVKYGESLVAGAMVSLSGYGSKITDENGRVAFNDVASMSGITYSVMAQNYKLLSGSLNVDESDIEKQIDLSASTFQASFIVQSENGLLVGAKVLVEGLGEQLTGSNGKVSFKNIPAGTTLNYVVTAPAHEDLIGRIMVAAANINQLLELSFVGYSVTFNVTDADGNPVDGAEILFNGETLLTDDNGEVVFGGVNVAESIAYTVLLAGYETQNGNLSINGEGVVETVKLITTDINDLVMPEIKVYPNPAQHLVTVENVEGYTIDIYNMSGRLMKQINNPRNIERIDVSSFTAGVYILKVNDNITKLIVNSDR